MLLKYEWAGAVVQLLVALLRHFVGLTITSIQSVVYPGSAGFCGFPQSRLISWGYPEQPVFLKCNGKVVTTCFQKKKKKKKGGGPAGLSVKSCNTPRLIMPKWLQLYPYMQLKKHYLCRSLLLSLDSKFLCQRRKEIDTSSEVIQDYSDRRIVRFEDHYVIKYGLNISLIEGETMVRGKNTARSRSRNICPLFRKE